MPDKKMVAIFDYIHNGILVLHVKQETTCIAIRHFVSAYYGVHICIEKDSADFAYCKALFHDALFYALLIEQIYITFLILSIRFIYFN